eukprot:m.110103 g.110103  ORF g.110103 m.110103 type:complete len:56 (-) comp28010_c0_seq1:80-247(-)
MVLMYTWFYVREKNAQNKTTKTFTTPNAKKAHSNSSVSLLTFIVCPTDSLSLSVV